MSDKSVREIAEGPQEQGTLEKVYWVVDLAPMGITGTPQSVTVTVTKLSDSTDVTSTVTTGSATPAAGQITLPLIHDLADGEDYRVHWTFDPGDATQVRDGYMVLQGRE